MNCCQVTRLGKIAEIAIFKDSTDDHHLYKGWQKQHPSFLTFERKWDISEGTGWHEETTLNPPLHRRLHSHMVTIMLQDTISNC